MVLFHNYEELILKKIIIKRANTFSEIYRTQDIKYKVKLENKEIDYENIYIQTPYIFLRYGPQMYEGNIDSKIVLDIPLKVKLNSESNSDDDANNYDVESEKLYNLIKRLHKSLKTKLIKKENSLLKNIKDAESKVTKNRKSKRNKYIDCLKAKEDITDLEHQNYNLKTKIHSMNGKPYLKIYNSNRKLNKEQKFRNNTLTRFILHLESIWYFEDTYGFNWYVVQAEIKLPPVPNNYYFYNENEIEEKAEEVDDFNPRLEKFKKMKGMGIPQIVIENKMKLEGLNPRLLFNTIDISMSTPIPPPPPPPPPPSNLMLNKKTNIKAPKLETSINFRVPTLSQLQEKLKSLKKFKK